MTVLALVPAHDEEAGIGACVAALLAQVDQVIVVADNCTDFTAARAARAGAQVFITVGNVDRKAGALNQALVVLLPHFDGDILITDADSVIAADFVAVAADHLHRRADLGAVGGVFYGDPAPGLLARMQANEYRRYGRVLAQRRGRVHVLTGTAALIRRAALVDLLQVRGHVYDPAAITEDNELTLALKTAGWRLVSPARCTVTTQLMSTWGSLHAQRLRWYRGALDNLTTYGVTRVTAPYWAQQAGLAASTAAMGLYATLTAFYAATGQLGFNPWWAAVGAGFTVERVGTVWAAGPRARLLAAAVIPELVYDLVLQATFCHALATLIGRRPVTWTHPDAARV